MESNVLFTSRNEKLPLSLSQTGPRTGFHAATPSVLLSIRPCTGALVICPLRAAGVIVELAMSHFPRTDANQRAPRLQLNGSVAAAIHAEGGRRARAKLQSLSINGGLLVLQQVLSPGDFVEIAFHTRSGPILGMAEMLPPTRKLQSACLQPFRFVALGDDDHRKLRMALDTALDRSVLRPLSEQPQATGL